MLIFRASESALWMGTSTFGLFMSNVFPTSVALAEQYFNVTGNSMKRQYTLIVLCPSEIRPTQLPNHVENKLEMSQSELKAKSAQWFLLAQLIIQPVPNAGKHVTRCQTQENM